MAVALYMDVHVPGPITWQLRHRGVDVITAQDDAHERASDSNVFDRANSLGRLIFTQDIRFRALAEDWQRQGREFAGLLFGPQLGGTIGQYVEDLELIAKASEPRSKNGESPRCCGSLGKLGSFAARGNSIT